MLVRSEQIRSITKKLSEFTTYVKLSNDLDRTDVNRDAEYFYCKPLSILLGGEFKNLNSEERNYPAVDLGNSEKRICVQVTSTNNRTKIQKTLDKFFSNKQEKLFDRVIVLIIGEKQNYRNAFKVQKGFKFSMKDDVWDSARLLQEIQDLPDEKLAEVAAYLSSQIPGQKEDKRPVLTLRDSLPEKTPDRCIGREAELAQLERLLAEGCNPVYIWGLGGMGKTELAIHFGQEQTGRRVHFVRFTESFRLTITTGLADLVEGLQRKLPGTDISRPETEVYKDVMSVMARHKDDILIVDNVDGDLKKLLDDDYKELLNKGPRLIITTRNAKPGYVHVKRLDDASLYQIFRKHEAVVTQEEMDRLIAAVDGHTMTIDLMARTLAGGWDPVTAEEILDALNAQELADRISREVDSDYRPDEEQEKIYGHLRVLFNVAGIPPEGREALRYATLLPEAGMGTRLFFRVLPRHIGEKMLTGLSDRGWLGVANNMATIHPVVRLVCHEELKPTDENCAPFLDALWNKYDDKEYDHQKYTQMAELFATATDRLEDCRGTWADHGRKLWHTVGQADKALVMCEKVLKTLQSMAEPDLPALATAYNDLGHLHRDLGHLQLCLEYLEKALALRQEVLSEDDPDLAMSYNNVGVAHSELGDYYKALEYRETAMHLWERVLPPDHSDLALSYDNVGGSYGELGDHRKALEYKEKALEIRKRILPPDHPDIATSYNSAGTTYGNLGNYRKELEYTEKALSIRERILPHDHPDVAASYNNIGLTYGKMGDYQKELEYEEKSLRIREQILPSDHPDIATSYKNVGIAYSDTGDYQKALEYGDRSLRIRERILPPDHPDIATSYNNVGSIYCKIGDHQKALEYNQRALEIRERMLPSDHPDVARSCNELGNTYGRLGDHEKALECKRKALEIREQIRPFDHPDIALFYNDIGLTYAALGAYDQALEYFKKSLLIYEKLLLPWHPYIKVVNDNLAGWTQIAQMPKWKRLKMGYPN